VLDEGVSRIYVRSLRDELIEDVIGVLRICGRTIPEIGSFKEAVVVRIVAVLGTNSLRTGSCDETIEWIVFVGSRVIFAVFETGTISVTIVGIGLCDRTRS